MPQQTTAEQKNKPQGETSAEIEVIDPLKVRMKLKLSLKLKLELKQKLNVDLRLKLSSFIHLIRLPSYSYLLAHRYH